jgi:hypothetical protein
VGFLGYDYNRRVALQALAVSAAKSDVHSIFAGCAPLHAENTRGTLANGHVQTHPDVLLRHGTLVLGVPSRRSACFETVSSHS